MFCLQNHGINSKANQACVTFVRLPVFCCVATFLMSVVVVVVRLIFFLCSVHEHCQAQGDVQFLDFQQSVLSLQVVFIVD